MADPSGQSFRSAIDVRIDVSHLAADIQQTQARIKQAFYADLFLMMAEQEKAIRADPVGAATALARKVFGFAAK